MTMTAGIDGQDQRLAPPTSPRRPLPPISRALHWLMAILVLMMFITGVLMKQFGEGAIADALYTFHKTAGVCALALVLLRLGYRAVAQWQGRWSRGAGSHWVHGLLYLGLLGVPLLGWAGISDFGALGIYAGWSLPAIWPEGAGHAAWLFRSHAILAFLLLGCVAIHLGIALGAYIERGGTGARTRRGAPEGMNGASPSPPSVP